MDNDPQGGMDNNYPYRDYYSTGGRYRPPKRPRNYGWMAAVLGVFLLCVAGGMAFNRDYDREEPTSTLAAQSEQVSLASQTPALPTQTAEAVQQPKALLGSGTEMDVTQTEGSELTLQEIYKKVIPSVVSITAQSTGGKSTGTGIIMSDDGYIITNYHVLSNAQAVSVLLTSGEEYPAALVGGDETSDLVVLKIEAKNLIPAEFGSSDNAEVGDSVVAIGDPLGIELRGTMTDGIICGIKRDVRVDDRTMTLMQTNAALNSGNSGGPLVNMSGQVIGINTMKIASSYTTNVEGIGFAIPISTAKPIVDELVEKGYVSGRPAFGISVEILDSRVVLFYDLPGRLYITQVMENSDAWEKGIRSGDIITAVDGVSVSTMDEYNTVKNEFSAGDTVTLTVYHKGVELDVAVKLMDRADLD